MPDPATTTVRLGTARGRWVLFATVLGTGMAFLDGTVVNIALPTIGDDLDAGISGLQWTVNAYTLTLAGLLLLGGSLGDRYGRRKIFCVGAIWFAVASLLCGLAPSAELLIAARALQGIGAALLTPGSLAIIESAFHPDDRGAAIGAWSGLGGIAGAAGPFVGGYLIEAVSWRLIFLINLPIAALVVWVTVRHVPESRSAEMRSERLDLPGAALVALALGSVTYGLTAGPGDGWGSASVVGALTAGAVAFAAFLVRARRTPAPLVPLGMFRSRQFSGANAATFVVYAALGGALFLLPIQLQTTAGYSPLEAGAALVPMTIVMLALSARMGRLAQRIGPRAPMSIGPLIAACGLALMSRVDGSGGYATEVLPAVLLFALGLSVTVAPLTATVLAAGGSERSGVSSAINNAVARTAGLLAVAIIPAMAGVTTGVFGDGFARGMWIAAAVMAAGGAVAAVTIRNPDRRPPGTEPCASCPLDAPPLRGQRPATEQAGVAG